MEESTSAQVFAIVAPNERIEKIGLAPPLEIRGALQMECNALIRNVAKFTKQDFENGEFPTIPPASNGDPILTKVEDSFVQIKLLEIIQSNPPEGYPTMKSLKNGSYICDIFHIWPNGAVSQFCAFKV
jgi:hypothetical protein